MKAVILAAGQGLRIREHHQLPKGFIQLDQKTIIQQSLDTLWQFGIKDILVVTGYCAENYENLAKKTKQFQTLFNDNYAASSSLYSLYCAKNWVDDDFLLLESDIVYESTAIEAICTDEHANAILVSGTTNSGDEIYVTTLNQQLTNMAKDKNKLNQADIIGEFVGINKLSLDTYQALITLLKNDATLLNTGHYEEDGLVAIAKQHPVYCLKINDLRWCEIDNLGHLTRAKELFKYRYRERNLTQRRRGAEVFKVD